MRKYEVVGRFTERSGGKKTPLSGWREAVGITASTGR
jgi:hypothetical protein